MRSTPWAASLFLFDYLPRFNLLLVRIENVLLILRCNTNCTIPRLLYNDELLRTSSLGMTGIAVLRLRRAVPLSNQKPPRCLRYRHCLVIPSLRTHRCSNPSHPRIHPTEPDKERTSLFLVSPCGPPDASWSTCIAKFTLLDPSNHDLKSDNWKSDLHAYDFH